jgi:hypothetical protein
VTRFKKILLSLMVVGALGTIVTVRVLAVLSSDAQNPGSNIASGTFTANLTLSGGSGTCYTYKGTGTFTMTLSSSASSGNTSITVSSVPAVIALGTVLRLVDKSLTAGGHTEIVTVSANVGASGLPTVIPVVTGLVNNYAAGTNVFTDDYNEQGCDAIYSYNSGTLTPLMYPGIVQTAHLTLTNDGSVAVKDLSVWMPSCTKVDTPGIPAYAHLGADPCALNGPIFYIQETQSDFATTDSTHHCWYPSTATTCPLTGSLNNFSTNDNSQVFSIDMGAGPMRTDSAAKTRYFVVGTEEPANASNLLQGEAATFTLSWYLTAS